MVTQPAKSGKQRSIIVGLRPNLPARIPVPIAPNSCPILLRDAIQLASSLVMVISESSWGRRIAEKPSTVPDSVKLRIPVFRIYGWKIFQVPHHHSQQGEFSKYTTDPNPPNCKTIYTITSKLI